jgi:hypothetical protein
MEEGFTRSPRGLNFIFRQKFNSFVAPNPPTKRAFNFKNIRNLWNSSWLALKHEVVCLSVRTLAIRSVCDNTLCTVCLYKICNLSAGTLVLHSVCGNAGYIACLWERFFYIPSVRMLVIKSVCRNAGYIACFTAVNTVCLWELLFYDKTVEMHTL